MAWWLAHEELNGTMEETYPVKDFVDGHGDVHSVKVEGDDYNYSPYYYDYDRNGLDENPFKQDFLADNDDQAGHHFINNEVQQSDNMSAHYFKYHEDEILKDIESYVSGTYRGHYTGDTHEYRNVQTLDLMAAIFSWRCAHDLDAQDTCSSAIETIEYLR